MPKPTFENIGYVKKTFDAFLARRLENLASDRNSLRDSVLGLLRQDTAQAVLDVFCRTKGGRTPPLQTNQLIMLSLTERIPGGADLHQYAPVSVGLTGLHFRSAPAFSEKLQETTQTTLPAPYREPLRGQMLKDTRLLRIKPEHLRARSARFMEQISNKTIIPKIPVKERVEQALRGTPRPSRKQLGSTVGEWPIFEVESGKDLNTECRLDARALLHSWYPEVNFDDVEYVLFLDEGLLISSHDLEPRLLPANEAYRTYFTLRDSPNLEEDAPRNMTSAHDKHLGLLQSVVEEAVRECIERMHFADQTPLTQYTFRFKDRTGLDFKPGALTSASLMERELTEGSLLQFFSDVGPCMRPFFSGILVSADGKNPRDPFETYKPEQESVVVRHAQMKLFDQRHVKTVFERGGGTASPSADSGESRLFSVGLEDVNKLRQLDGYKIVLYQKILASIFGRLSPDLAPEYGDFSKLVSSLRPKVEGGLKGGVLGEDPALLTWAANRWLFVHLGVVYLLEQIDLSREKKTPKMVSDFFDRLFRKFNPARALSTQDPSSSER